MERIATTDVTNLNYWVANSYFLLNSAGTPQQLWCIALNRQHDFHNLRYRIITVLMVHFYVKRKPLVTYRSSVNSTQL